MENIDNNQFEVKPTNSKRKITIPRPNVYLNPALDILANDDPICNTAMEIPTKKRKRSKSCDFTTFENIALDLEVQKAPSNEFLVRELNNVKRNVKYCVIEQMDPEKNPEFFEKPIFKYVPDLDIDIFNVNNVDTFTADSDPEKNPEFCEKPIFKVVPDFNNDVSKVNSVHNFTVDSNISNNLSIDAYNSVGIPQSNDITEPIYANLTDINVNVSKNEKNTAPTEIENTELNSINDTGLNSVNDTRFNLENDRKFNSVNDTNLLLNHDKNNTLFSTDISRINHVDFDSGISVLESKKEPTQAVTNIQVNQTVVNSNLSLSFIDRLAIDSPNTSDRSLFLDDDLNESNIMEIKTITIITKKKRIEKKNTNPFLDPNINNEMVPNNNPFLDLKEVEYQDEVMARPVDVPANTSAIVPRKLFDTNSTISTVNESLDNSHEYENIDIRPESPIYENIDATINKQSKLLGYDVSHFSATDILNLHANNSNDSTDSKKKNSLLKAGNKLSKKVFKTLKKTFKHDKQDTNTTLNPYEVPRKLPKQKSSIKESGITNPALNLDNSDDLEIEELSDEEHQYETIKTIRNTKLNMNVTPLRVKDNDIDYNPKTLTPGKKVRFDSTLNQEKVITGNSFDFDLQSPGFDTKIEKYHDELENCINERKFLQQNM